MLAVDTYPASGCPFYRGGDRPRSIPTLSWSVYQAALVTDQHAPKNRHRSFLRLRMRINMGLSEW